MAFEPADDETNKWQQLDDEEQAEIEVDDDIEPEAAEASQDAAELTKALEAAQAEAKAHFDKMMLLQADMQNQQRRAERDIANAHKYALDKFVEALLPIVDSFEHALAAAQAAEVPAITEGLVLTHKMFLDTLAKFKVERVGEQGDKFDPELHEAMAMQPATEDCAAGHILQVFQAGYTLNGRLVRPARVIVAQ